MKKFGNNLVKFLFATIKNYINNLLYAATFFCFSLIKHN